MNKPIHPAVAEHVMEENERLRGLLREVRVLLSNSSYKISGTAAFLSSIDAALSQQAEPECECKTECFDCAVAKVPLQQAEPAPAQDEREAFEAFQSQRPSHWRITNRAAWEAALKYAAENYRPAQAEQQPVAWPEFVERAAQILDAEQERLSAEDYLMDSDDCVKVLRETVVTPIAQTAPQPEQSGLNDDSKEAAMQKAFELGGLEDGSYHLESDELELVIRSALSTQGASK